MLTRSVRLDIVAEDTEGKIYNVEVLRANMGAVARCARYNPAIPNGSDLSFDDGCTIIYVNGAYRGNDAIGWLMHDFCEQSADKMHYGEIAENSPLSCRHCPKLAVESLCRLFWGAFPQNS